MERETLSRYVRRIMKQKSINARDIERNSSKKIDNSYVSKILSGTVINPSINAVVGLAEGLGVDPHEVFAAASGFPIEGGRTVSADAVMLLDLMQNLIAEPQLIEVLKEWTRLLPEDREQMLHSLKFLNEQNDKRRRGRSRGKK
jgi:transcriptional regulator with XRE-family HTH domain